MCVLSFSIDAAKNSRKRRDARSPASAIIAGTTSELRSVDTVTGAAVSTTAGTLRRSALTASALAIFRDVAEGREPVSARSRVLHKLLMSSLRHSRRTGRL
jgi:hypothetical protein